MNTIIETIRAEIKRLISNEMELMKNSTEKCGDYPPSSDIMLVAYQCVLSFLDTLQEQPVKTNIVEDLKHYLATTPKEQIEKDWESLKEWGKVGPTVSEFLGWKQLVCEELGDEIDRFRETEEYLLAEKAGETDVVIARHFYELGRQSGCVKVKAESSIDKFILENCTHCTIEHCPGMRECYTSFNEQLQ